MHPASLPRLRHYIVSGPEHLGLAGLGLILPTTGDD
jgi:hypothetical protein